jgi:hypothetical protein
MESQSPDEQIAQKIVDDLKAKELIDDKQAAILCARLSDGDMKAEDWIALASQIYVNE